MSEKSINLVILILLALIWGSSFVLMAKILTDSNGASLYSPLSLGALRLVLAGLSLSPIALYRLKNTPLDQLRSMSVVGILGNGLPAFLFAISLTRIESGIAGILNSLTPLFTVIIGAAMFQAFIKKKAIIGVVLGLIGALGLVLSKTPKGSNSDDYLLYAFFIVAATLCYAISVNTIQHKLKGIPSISIAAIGLFIVSIPAAFILAFSDFYDVLTTHPEGLNGLFYALILSVIGTALALVLFNRLVQSSSAVFASMVTYLIPIVAIIWGIIFGETYGWIQLLFAGVILAGVFIVRKNK